MEVRPEPANSPCSRLPKQKSSANLSREARLWTTVVDELPGGHSKGGGFSSAALEGSVALPSGADPRTGQRAPTQGPAITKAKRVSARVFCLLPVLACLWRGFPGSGSLVLRPCPFGFLFGFWFPLVFLSFGRGPHVPAPGGRDVGSNSGAPTQEPVFSGISLHLVLFNLLFANSAASVLIGEVSEAVYECGRGGERSR